MKIRVADEVWIVTALLHRRHPDRDDFTVSEIVRQAETEKVADGPLRAGVRSHVYQHCVANKAPNSGRYRMLFETSKGRRRLFRPGDPCHPRRNSGKEVPRDDEIPPAYRELVDWYRNEYAGGGGGREADSILSLRGLGKAIWADEDPDAYVDRLRGLQQAAASSNKNVTEFLLDAGLNAAEDVLGDQRLFRLDDDAWRAFQEVLDRPVTDKPRLAQLLAGKSVLE